MTKKLAAILLCTILALDIMNGCTERSGGMTSDNKDVDSRKEITSENDVHQESKANETMINVTFWSAPKQTQCDYWTALAEDFNLLGATYDGKKINVTVEMTPETDSSESVIQNALATDSAPVASENINNSFMAILADAGAVYPVTGEDWFTEIITRKQITDDVIKTWMYKNEYYVLPEYINPICLQWNVKALKALGFDEPPVTYEKYLEVIRAYADHWDEMRSIGCEFAFNRKSFLNPSKWWHRNYDVMMMYQSFGGGEFYDGNRMNIDPEIMQNVFKFYGVLGNTMSLDSLSDRWTGESPLVLFDIGCPWEIVSYDAAGLVYGEDYVFAPSIVMNEGDIAHGYADTKGIVFYKDTNITEDMHRAMIEFIKYVYNETNCANNDLAFFEATAQMPVRGDLLSNDIFNESMSGDEWKILAEMIGDAKQGPCHSESVAMYETMCETGLAPYFTETCKQPAMTEVDSSNYVSNMIEQMIDVGGMEQ